MFRPVDLLILIFVIGFALLVVTAARSSPQCLTLSEAREQYGSRWLYWHTEHRCWDDHKRNDRDWPHAKPSPSRDTEKHGTPHELGVAAGETAPQTKQGIWPDPPTEIGFGWRWPDSSPIRSPLQWWRELMEFNR